MELLLHLGTCSPGGCVNQCIVAATASHRPPSWSFQIFQAVLFYIPRVLLKMWHHPLLQDMQENLRQALVCRTDEESVSKRDAVAKESNL